MCISEILYYNDINFPEILSYSFKSIKDDRNPFFFFLQINQKQNLVADEGNIYYCG